jgi:hypothetical protein
MQTKCAFCAVVCNLTRHVGVLREAATWDGEFLDFVAEDSTRYVFVVARRRDAAWALCVLREARRRI